MATTWAMRVNGRLATIGYEGPTAKKKDETRPSAEGLFHLHYLTGQCTRCETAYGTTGMECV